MNPCAKNKKTLSWLAIDAVDAVEARGLQAHMESCAGCRNYFAEISNLAGRFDEFRATSEIEATEMFHRGLARRIDSEARPGIFATVFAPVRPGALNWRVALPIAGVMAAIVMLLITSAQQHVRPPVARVVEPIALAEKPVNEVTPTFGNYRMLANRSLDALDQELTREAQASLAGASTYTASNLAQVIATD
jgi:hypothetical protein